MATAEHAFRCRDGRQLMSETASIALLVLVAAVGIVILLFLAGD